jgi:hypothetical protein
MPEAADVRGLMSAVVSWTAPSTRAAGCNQRLYYLYSEVYYGKAFNPPPRCHRRRDQRDPCSSTRRTGQGDRRQATGTHR